MEQKLKALPLMKSDARAFTRFFFSGATECELDKQGRVNTAGQFKRVCQAGQGLCCSWRVEPGGDLEQRHMGELFQSIRRSIQRHCRKAGRFQF